MKKECRGEERDQDKKIPQRKEMHRNILKGRLKENLVMLKDTKDTVSNLLN